MIVDNIGSFLGSGAKRIRVDGAVLSISYELGAWSIQVNTDEWCNMELSFSIGDELKEAISQFFKVLISLS